ncbi:MAG: tetratricopeptide repeat protein [Cyanobacteria bacterium REEB459]|nr:tetratricopeptide repeat protein [Cyanobacteria bacterium REEB459]
MASTIPLPSHTFLGHNQESYQDLRQTLQLSLRRQLLIAVCDNTELQEELAHRLEIDLRPDTLAPAAALQGRPNQSPLVTLRLDLQQPDLVRQVLVWLKRQRFLQGSLPVIPAFQILGVESLTRQSATVQNRFLASLAQVDTLLTRADCRLVVWIPRPWLGKIRQSVPAFWRSRSGLFEFVGEPGSYLAEGAANSVASTPEQQNPSPTPGLGTHSGLTLPPELAADAVMVDHWADLQDLMERQAGPLTLARSRLVLGQLSRDRIEAGAQAPSTLDFALTIYQQTILDLVAGQSLWCDALNDLAGLYWLRSQLHQSPDHRIDALNHSIELYQQALAGAPADLPVATLRRIWTNLGAVYSLLTAIDDQPTHLEQAARAYSRALECTAATSDSSDHGNLQNNLGTIYWRLAQGDRPEYYLNLAIEAYSQALDWRSAAVDPLDYAMLQNNLGIAHWSLAQHQQSTAPLLAAINAYQAALQYRSLDRAPLGYAATQNNLGTAYWDLAQYQLQQPDQRRQSLQQALAAYTAALETTQLILQQDPDASLGFDRFATCHSLGVVHDQLAQILPSPQGTDRQEHLQSALANYLMAYQGWRDRPEQLDVLGEAVAHHIHLTFDRLGMAAQQDTLSRLPGELLARVLPGGR